MEPRLDSRGTVCVLGLGYIGLPTASLLATRGFAVTGVDVNPQIVDTINRGQVHIVEPELDTLVSAAVKSGGLKATTAPVSAQVFVIAVPTPFKADKAPDISYVEAATRLLAPCLKPGNLVILESTSPVGTTERVAEILAETRPDLAIASGKSPHDAETVKVAHCPERVLPGKILRELIENDRIVGGIDAGSAEAALRFYKSFVSGGVYATDSRTAELAKLTENAFRDVNIAFANELSLICDDLHIDVWELIALANKHPRVNILNPGPGVGGHCIAVDPWFIVHTAKENAALIKQARLVNDRKPHVVAEKILVEAKQRGAKTIALFGLSYKANIDDLRESPAVEVATLVAAGFKGSVLVAEPYVSALPAALASANVALADAQNAVDRADVAAMLVPHDRFRSLTLESARRRGAAFLDFCGGWRNQ